MTAAPTGQAATVAPSQAETPACGPSLLTTEAKMWKRETGSARQLGSVYLTNTSPVTYVLEVQSESVRLVDGRGNLTVTANHRTGEFPGSPITLEPGDRASLDLNSSALGEDCSRSYGVNFQLPDSDAVLYAGFPSGGDGFQVCDDDVNYFDMLPRPS